MSTGAEKEPINKLIKMKIALYYNLPAGGAKRYIFEAIKRLCEKHLIDVYTLSTSDMFFCNFGPYVKNTFVYDFKSLKLLEFPCSRLNWIIQLLNIVWMERLLKKAAFDIDSRNYDVVFCNTCVNTEIPLIIKHLKTPVVYIAHSTTFPLGIIREEKKISSFRKSTRKNIPDFGQKLFNHILKRKQKENIKKTSLVLSVSNYLADKLNMEYEVSAKVNYPGIDFNKFVPDNVVKKEHLIISVGTLQPSKAHDFVVESVGLIDKKIRPCLGIAYHIGSDEEKKYLIHLADKKGVNLKLFEDQNIVELYNKAKVVVVTSFFEGLGLVALEAMACGVPVIGVNEGGIRETILHEKTGFLLNRDPEKFAEAIQYLLENENIAKEYGQNGRNYVIENWSWEKSASNLEVHFKKFLKKGDIYE